MMVAAHSASTTKLNVAAGSATPEITPDADMSGEQEANLQTLRNATGTNFDTAYKDQQLAAHQQSLAAMQTYRASGDVPELKAFASTMILVVQEHLEKLRTL